MMTRYLFVILIVTYTYTNAMKNPSEGTPDTQQLQNSQQVLDTAVTRFNQKMKELFPGQIQPSNENCKIVLRQLSFDDRCTFFNQNVNSGEYHKAIFVGNETKEYFPAYLVSKSGEYYQDALYEMQQLSQ